jgi:methyl coenzyme M reductase subunit C
VGDWGIHPTWRNKMMMVDPEVFVDSPNRFEPHATQSAVEVVVNTVEKIPEMGVKFEGEEVLLKTSYSARLQDHAQTVIEFGVKLDEIAEIIKEKLKACGYPKAKLTQKFIDVDPGMWRSAGTGLANRQLIYTVVGAYTLEV